MKKLIKKWLGITDLKEKLTEQITEKLKLDFRKSFFDNHITLDNTLKCIEVTKDKVKQVNSQQTKHDLAISELKSKMIDFNKRIGDNSVAIEILKDTLDIDKPKKETPKKAAKKTPPKKVTKK